MARAGTRTINDPPTEPAWQDAELPLPPTWKLVLVSTMAIAALVGVAWERLLMPQADDPSQRADSVTVALGIPNDIIDAAASPPVLPSEAPDFDKDAAGDPNLPVIQTEPRPKGFAREDNDAWYHVTQAGDNYWKIAKAYRPDAIMKAIDGIKSANPEVVPERLQPGTTLKVPRK
jgi:hypothetical protein